jgi:hypothetical protein
VIFGLRLRVGSSHTVAMKIFSTCARYAHLLGSIALAFSFAMSAGAAVVIKPEGAAALSKALQFHASFDKGIDADYAVGDAKLYTALTGNRQQARPGLPDDGLVLLAPGAGITGNALRFTKKMKPVVFYKGDKNINYRSNQWSGAVSFWLKLDPDRDLEPGYCDALQIVGQAWDEGNMFIEFSKDHTPRHLRYAIRAVTKLWNPKNLKWEEIPDVDRPMVPVYRPMFSREKWTHVCFSFGNINSGRKDGWGRLHLDGKYQGEIRGWENTFNWDASRTAVTIGLAYVGLFDDLAVFDRPLTDAEVDLIHDAKGLASLVR